MAVLDTATGRLLRTVSLAPPSPWPVVDPQSGRVFLLTSSAGTTESDGEYLLSCSTLRC